jgi:DNA-directed RNA polymerase sigma subunit (sigma70/sigma32)
MDVRWRVQKTGRVVRPVLIIDDDWSFREAAGMVLAARGFRVIARQGTALAELIADDNATDPSEGAIESDESRTVWNMPRLLPERHRAVVVRRYGFDQQAPESHEQIGTWLEISEERSHQLEREALHRLRTIATARAA